MMPKPIFITCGSPHGINSEILTKALQCLGPQIPIISHHDPRSLHVPNPHILKNIQDFRAGFFNILPTDLGQTQASIDLGIDLCLTDLCAGLVTLPIDKAHMAKNIPNFCGHTEYLEKACNASKTIMLMSAPELKVIPLTGHLSLTQALQSLNPDKISTEIAHIHQLLQTYLKKKPKLALCALNPHAGDGGIMGKEEQTWITPMIKDLQLQGLDLHGPIPTDTAFIPQQRSSYDVILGLYHDQVLTPIKALYFDSCINITLGLPFLRTSPDHGPAFDLAGKNLANPQSLIHAIKAHFT